MTFDAARARHLAALDAQWLKLRAIIADPNVNNPDYRELRQAQSDLESICVRIRALNSAQLEAESEKVPPQAG